MARTKKIEVVKCAQCPAQKSARVLGLVHNGHWFCSHNCIYEYEEDQKLDALADHDGTDYRGIKTN